MDSVVDNDFAEAKRNAKKRFHLVIGLTVIVVALASAASYTYNDHSNKRVYEKTPVDLSSRPLINAVHSGRNADGTQNIVPLKVINFGEVDRELSFWESLYKEQRLAERYKVENRRAFLDSVGTMFTNIPKLQFNFPISRVGGRAIEILKDDLSFGSAVCLVQSRQTGVTSSDGTYYLFTDDIPIYAKKDLVDFAIKSHEGGHCFFRTLEGKQDPDDRSNDYKEALMEVSGDLTSILDYARVTGTLDMFTDFWRPYRLASAGDDIHQTAWALDVVLQDKSIDLDAIKRKGPEEIGPMVTYLMEKHFADPNGEFTITQSTASQALSANLKAQKWFDGDSPEDSDLKARLKADIAQTMVDHRAKWASIAPKDAVDLFDKRLARWSDKFGIDISTYTPTSAIPHQDRLNSKRPMGVLEYLTGKDYAL